MQNVNLFIVESPFQLLSAIEANFYFSNEENILIIKYSNETLHYKNNKQINELKKNISWKEIIEIKSNSKYNSGNIQLLFLLKKIKKYNFKINKIFIGEYRSWFMRQFFNILNPQQCFVLDDGNIVIELAKSYISKGKEYQSNVSFRSRIKKIIEYLLLIYIVHKIPKKRVDINLFTCFNVDHYLEKNRFIKHSFDFLKKKSKTKVLLKNTVYFLGGNISELEILNKQDEIELIKKIYHFFNKKNIKMVYLPHRREKMEKIEFIQNKLSIEIRFSTYPIEIEMMKIEKVPQYLSSFASTALHTVPQIINLDEVIVFKIPLEKINSFYKEAFKTLYDEYQKTIKVINLDELT